MKTIQIKATKEEKLLNYALSLAIFTVLYNLAEGIVSIYFGVKDEVLSLAGFGADSFIETISALGICVMIYRMKKYPASEKSKFEITALRITGWCFYVLAVVLGISAVIKMIVQNPPTSTVAGIIISSVSILSMWLLVRAKKSVGKKLNSAPLIADANCNLVCVYMSVVLLLASGFYALFEIGFIDILGTVGIIYFSVKEGKESFEKAKGIHACSCGCG